MIEQDVFSNFSEDVSILLEIINEHEEDKRKWHIRQYQPKQKQIDFYSEWQRGQEICFMAGNQLGKTYGAGAGLVPALTGLYDEFDWYTGCRWDGPISVMVGGHTSEFVRDTVQEKLLGEFELESEDSNRAVLSGDGLIPKDLIARISRKKAPADCVDTVWIKHTSGRLSKIMFKSFDQGYRKFAGKTVDVVWLDEDPCAEGDGKIIDECQKRVKVKNGLMLFTLTATEGMTETAERFYPEPKYKNGKLIMFGIRDDETLTPEQIEDEIEKTEPEWRACRLDGHPYQGSGKVYKAPRELWIKHPNDYQLPPLCTYAHAFDFGYQNFVCLWMAYDEFKDVLYVIDEYHNGDQQILYHAAEIKAKDKILFGDNAKVITAFPHDGNANDDDGNSKRDLWERHGIEFMDDFSHFLIEKTDTRGNVKEEKSISVKKGIDDLRDRMRTNRLIIDARCETLIRQMDYYHFKDGKIVKENDHGCDAVRVGLMSKDKFERVANVILLSKKIQHVTEFDVLSMAN